MGLARFALVLSMVAGSAGASPSGEWQPSGKWVVRFEKNQCMALRGFVRGDRKITVGFESKFLSPYYSVLFEMPGSPTGLGLDRASLVVGRERQPSRSALIGPSKKSGFQIISFTATDKQLEDLEAHPWVQFSAAGKTIRVPVTSFRSVQELLDRCEAQVLASWGFSFADQARIATYPKTGKGLLNVFTADDYPSSALKRDAVGQVDLRAMVGLDGKARDCVIVRSSGHPDLDTATCALFIQRNRYSPGVATDGRPMVAPVFVTVRWLMG
ncbi:energy transducer TonB [Sphingomonas sp. GCM10030256]|uniref:energy transducer TonB n=1 Tax=Sphingomonas sp. GCM10030256 TaxID=3273427 RepID=UPI0036124684